MHLPTEYISSSIDWSKTILHRLLSQYRVNIYLISDLFSLPSTFLFLVLRFTRECSVECGWHVVNQIQPFTLSNMISLTWEHNNINYVVDTCHKHQRSDSLWWLSPDTHPDHEILNIRIRCGRGRGRKTFFPNALFQSSLSETNKLLISFIQAVSSQPPSDPHV